MNTYPTALVLLREISTHLGLKAYTKLSDEIDEHISNPHYPHYFEEKFLCTRQISQNPYPIRILPS